MTSPVSDTWHERDLPVLRATVEALDGQLTGIEPESLVEPTGLVLDDVKAALIALNRGKYIKMNIEMMLSGDAFLTVYAVKERAYRAAGAWPSREAVADRLIEALRDLADYSDDPIEKSRARKALDGLGSFSRDTLVSIAGAAVGVAVQ